MRAEDWERAEELFHRLAPLDDDGRKAALADLARTEPDLGGELASLLSAHDAGGVFDHLTAKLAPEPFGKDLATSALTGTKVAQYEIGPLIGRGGMGEVYRARDTRLGREVALKFLPGWLGRDPSAHDRFLVEARIVSAIDHPNVCSLYELGESEDGRLFIVMPLYAGESLESRLMRGTLTAEQAVDVALQAARGLAAAHSRGVVHRDIKPANLLLCDDGQVKVLDFGVAKLTDVSLTRPDENPGTERYMSPEQADGDEVDERSDLWAVGAVLCEMLTGRTPSKRDPLARRPGPPEVRSILERLLAPSPPARYPDAQSLIRDLEAADRAVPGSRRWMTAAGATMILAGAIAVLFVGRTESPGSVTSGMAAATSADASVAIFPFTVVGDRPVTKVWGEGIVHLLSPDLAEIDGLRPIDATVVARRWHDRTPTTGAASDIPDGLAIAADLGASYAVFGTAVGTGPDVRLTAEVYDVPGGTRRGSATVDGRADSLPLVDELALRLLGRGLLPARSVPPARLAGVMTGSLPAFEAYLEGEREYRTGRYRIAGGHFARAAELDPTFARAVYRAWMSYVFAFDSLEAEYARRAEGMVDRLSPRDSVLLFGFPRDFSPAALPSLRRYVSRYPLDPEGWVRLGDATFHLGGAELVDPAEYRKAWAKGFQLGGVYEEGRGHLLQDAFLRRDSATVRALLDQATRQDGDMRCPPYRALYEATWGLGTKRIEAQRELAASADSALVCTGEAVAVSRVAVDRLKVDWYSEPTPVDYLRLLGKRVLRGELSEAEALIEQAAARPDYADWSARYAVLLGLIGLGDPATADAGAAWLARLRPSDVAPDIFRLGPLTGPFWIGVRAIERGRFEDVPLQRDRMKEAAGELRRQAADDSVVRAATPLTRDDMLEFSAWTEQLADVLEAYAAFRRSDNADAAIVERSVAGLSSKSRATREYGAFVRYATGVELLRREDPREAIRYLRSVYVSDPIYWVPAQFFLGKAYEAVGERRQAREHYRIFVEWWGDADPSLLSWVSRGRQALERTARD